MSFKKHLYAMSGSQWTQSILWSLWAKALHFLGLVNLSELICFLLQRQLLFVLSCSDSASSTSGGGGALAVEDGLPHPQITRHAGSSHPRTFNVSWVDRWLETGMTQTLRDPCKNSHGSLRSGFESPGLRQLIGWDFGLPRSLTRDTPALRAQSGWLRISV